MFLLSTELPYALDLVNGPGYADLREVAVEKGELTSLALHFFEPIPARVSLIGRVYIDQDSNTTTGYDWSSVRGADLLMIFTLRRECCSGGEGICS